MLDLTDEAFGAEDEACLTNRAIREDGEGLAAAKRKDLASMLKRLSAASRDGEMVERG